MRDICSSLSAIMWLFIDNYVVACQQCAMWLFSAFMRWLVHNVLCDRFQHLCGSLSTNCVLLDGRVLGNSILVCSGDGSFRATSNASPATDAPEDSSFVNFFSVVMNIRTNATNGTKPLQPCNSILSTPLHSHTPSIISTTAPTPSVPSLPLFAPPLLNLVSSSNRLTNLVKPSSFLVPYSLSSSPLMMPPISTSTPTASALHPPLNLQRPYGTPMLQPFPPPTPPTSLTHVGPPTLHYGLIISRDKVRDALLMLAQ
ncbi:hypothetical protein Gogos_009304, partial [Gossypium gossypioides]|nr:hypothetical protein [Gossypium gossypioides]